MDTTCFQKGKTQINTIHSPKGKRIRGLSFSRLVDYCVGLLMRSKRVTRPKSLMMITVKMYRKPTFFNLSQNMDPVTFCEIFLGFLFYLENHYLQLSLSLSFLTIILGIVRISFPWESVLTTVSHRARS